MRLIDADALRKCFEAEYETAEGVQVSMDRYTLKCIDDAPTIDAEPVVRCKDCKHYSEWQNGTGSCQRSENGCFWFGVDFNDFCSFGERREP